MKFCAQCEQANPDEALFCHRCGSRFGDEGPATPQEEEQLWRTFIGPSKTILFSLKDGWSWDRADRYYMEQFRKFTSGGSPRFELTWHWPAFFVDPFLWFLYRKMYLYAAVYLVGPVLFFYLTGDMTVGFIWRVIAGASANYLYYWHVKDHLKEIRGRSRLHRPIPDDALRDTGGVQPYVFGLAILLHLFVMAAILQGPPDQETVQDQQMSPERDPELF